MKLTLERLPARARRAPAAGAIWCPATSRCWSARRSTPIRAARAGRAASPSARCSSSSAPARSGRRSQQAAQSLSLFADARMIEMRLPTGKAGRPAARRCSGCIAAAGEDLLLLIVTGKLDRDTQGAAWVRALQERGAWLAIWPLDRARLPHWLRARFARAPGSRSSEALAAARRAQRRQSAGRAAGDRQAALLLPRGAARGAAGGRGQQRRQRALRCFQLGEAVRGARCGARAADPRRSAGRRRRAGAGAVGAAARAAALQAAMPRGRAPARAADRAADCARGARRSHGQGSASPGDAWDELALLAVGTVRRARRCRCCGGLA